MAAAIQHGYKPEESERACVSLIDTHGLPKTLLGLWWQATTTTIQTQRCKGLIRCAPYIGSPALRSWRTNQASRLQALAFTLVSHAFEHTRIHTHTISFSLSLSHPFPPYAAPLKYHQRGLQTPRTCTSTQGQTRTAAHTRPTAAVPCRVAGDPGRRFGRGGDKGWRGSGKRCIRANKSCV